MAHFDKSLGVLVLAVALFLALPGGARGQDLVITTGYTDVFTGVNAGAITVTVPYTVLQPGEVGAAMVDGRITVRVPVWSWALLPVAATMLLFGILHVVKWVWDLLPFL